MVRSDKNAASPAAGDEGGEIDRIMKEIEELERKMDTTGGEEAQAPQKVVSIRPAAPAEEPPHRESLAESDAVPASREPLMRTSSASSGGGALGLRIGGCAEISLEFTRSGMTVTLSCTDDVLMITTDQGAEFRIPFKRAA